MRSAPSNRHPDSILIPSNVTPLTLSKIVVEILYSSAMIAILSVLYYDTHTIFTPFTLLSLAVDNSFILYSLITLLHHTFTAFKCRATAPSCRRISTHLTKLLLHGSSTSLKSILRHHSRTNIQFRIKHTIILPTFSFYSHVITVPTRFGDHMGIYQLQTLIVFGIDIVQQREAKLGAGLFHSRWRRIIVDILSFWTFTRVFLLASSS